MSSKRLYRGASIASEDSPKLTRADVLVEGDRIIGVAAKIEKAENTINDLVTENRIAELTKKYLIGIAVKNALLMRVFTIA